MAESGTQEIAEIIGIFMTGSDDEIVGRHADGLKQCSVLHNGSLCGILADKRLQKSMPKSRSSNYSRTLTYTAEEGPKPVVFFH